MPVQETTKSKGGFKITRQKRSTNKCDIEPYKPKRFKENQPSVTDHFSNKRHQTADNPEDCFCNAGND